MKLRLRRNRCLFCGAPASTNYYLYNCKAANRKFSVCERCLERIQTDREYDKCVFCGKVTEAVHVVGRSSIVHNPQAPYIVRTVIDKLIEFDMPVCPDCMDKLEIKRHRTPVVICDSCRREVHPELARTISVRGNRKFRYNNKIGDFCEDCLIKAVKSGRCVFCGKEASVKIPARSMNKKVQALNSWTFELPLCEEHAKPFVEQTED